MGSVRNLPAAAMSTTVAAVTGTLSQHPEAANYRIGIGARIAPGLLPHHRTCGTRPVHVIWRFKSALHNPPVFSC